MIIRLATLDDIEPIMKLVKEVVPLMRESGNFQWDNKYPNAEVFAADISLRQLWVAEIDGNIAGVSAITTEQSEEYGNVGWDLTEPAIVTHRLAVNLQYRGRGIAEALLMQAEVVANSRKITVVRIDTNSNNKATQKLFPKMGYVYAGETGLGHRPNLKFYCYEKRITERENKFLYL